MKKAFLLFLGILLVNFSSVYAVDKTLVLGWDYNKADYPVVKGFKVYKGSTAGAASNLEVDVPVGSITPIDASATIYSIEKEVTLNIPENAVTEIFFSATAYNENGESEKSDEASVTFDFLAPPAIADLAAQYNEDNQTITFNWTYPQDWLGKILRWELYKGDASGGPYDKVVEIPYDPNASQPYTTDVAITLPTTGSKVTTYYTMVAVRPAENNYTYSADSNETQVTINLMPPNAPFEFKIRVK
jgi:hypothetical protein